MNVFRHFRDQIAAVLAALAEAGVLPADSDFGRVTCEPPRDAAHGDMATNAALVLAKAAGTKPRDLAGKIAEGLRALDSVAAVEVAGPGFINIRVADRFWQDRVADILAAGPAYGDADFGQGEPVNVEFTSANPTGLLHIAHARGTVFGDALAALLEKAGYAVTREYYVNDWGGQVDILAESLLKRMRQLQGEAVPEAEFEGLYPGREVIDAAEAALKLPPGERPDPMSGSDENRARAGEFAVGYMMDRIRHDLAALGVRHDVFTSERSLVEAGAVDAAFADLEGRGLIYTGILEPPKGKLPDDWEERPQSLFRATRFGDATDRPLKKSNGDWTYFATDIAYHQDKAKRGANRLIDVWGADHQGYIPRMTAAVDAVTRGTATLDVKVIQLVRLIRDGTVVKMSKRAGNVVTVRDVVDEVGKDVVRFVMLTRRNDAPLDFDFARVTEQSKDNPVFYVQYAHARSHSVFRQTKDVLPDIDTGHASLVNAKFGTLTNEGELSLIKKLTMWPRVIESAAETHEPHRIAYYLYDIAADFHAHWNRGRDEPELRFVRPDDLPLTLARLALVKAVATVIASGLVLFGVAPAEEMR
ncbi:MAG: arginine--tRNA ligase [Rhodospirillaceae bacterium]|nr:arginine--tRNA ligase [Rhodospirillaceae bacterium]